MDRRAVLRAAALWPLAMTACSTSPAGAPAPRPLAVRHTAREVHRGAVADAPPDRRAGTRWNRPHRGGSDLPRRRGRGCACQKRRTGHATC
jgi:hypothetical protein